MKTDILVIAGRDTNMVNRPGIEIVCDQSVVHSVENATVYESS